LFPVLTLFRCNISCHLLQQKSCPSQRTACNQRKTLDHGGFSTFLIAIKTGHQQAVHIFPPVPFASIQQLLDFKSTTNRLTKSIPIQHTLLHYSIIDSVQDKPANSFSKCKGILKSKTIFQPLLFLVSHNTIPPPSKSPLSSLLHLLLANKIHLQRHETCYSTSKPCSEKSPRLDVSY
jgi:hypothetical protein